MDDNNKTPNAIVMNTVIASAASGLTHTLMTQWRNMTSSEELIARKGYGQSFNMWELSNSVVAGYVSITAGCNNVQLWESCIIGFIGSLIYQGTRKLLIRTEIDDPLDTTQVHGLCGFWAILSRGIFDNTQGMLRSGDTQFVAI